MKKMFKQPNGKYCCIDYDGFLIFSNYTEQDVINMYIEKAKEDVKKANSSGDIIKEMLQNETLRHEAIISNEQLKSMGFSNSYKELVKFIPRKPTDTKYIACDFTTYGKCPNCGKKVEDGIGHTDKKCTCGQLLTW